MNGSEELIKCHMYLMSINLLKVSVCDSLVAIHDLPHTAAQINW